MLTRFHWFDARLLAVVHAIESVVVAKATAVDELLALGGLRVVVVPIAGSPTPTDSSRQVTTICDGA